MKTEQSNILGSERKRVFLVDQFPISRLAVSEWLRQTPDLTVCGEADNETIALTSVRRLQPDLVVTEVLRQQDLGFIRSLHKRHPRLPILVFSFRDEEWYAPRALEAGADGYLMKGVNPVKLVDGIRATLKGRLVLSPEMRAQFLLKCARRARLSTAARRSRQSHSQGKERK